MEMQVNLIEDLKLLKLSMQALSKLKEINDYLKKKKTRRSCCVRLINRDRKRNGFYNVSFLKIKEEDIGQFFSYTNMSPELYDNLLVILKPMMIKTSLREAISPACRLAVVLHFLTKGTPMQSLALSFKLGRETVRSIILETTEIIWQTLMPLYLSEPTADENEQICLDFWNMWNMPNCVGAIDGKHFAIRSPAKSRNQSLKSKKHQSIVLLAVCDAKYQFTYVDVGAYGNPRDGGIFKKSSLGQKLLENTLPIPIPTDLLNSQTRTANYFVGNRSFPLGPNLMRPYPGVLLPPEKENFNKRISKAHSTIENCFGILISRWGILLTTMHMIPENAKKIVLACLTLHNYLIVNGQNTSSLYCPKNYVDWEDSDGQHHNGLWRSEIENINPSLAPSPNFHQYGGTTSTIVRNILCEYLEQN